MERIVFHIGTHKTGSSAIQGSLLESAGALLARGVLYPRTGRGRPGHARLFDELREDSGREGSGSAGMPLHRALLDEVEQTKASELVLSSEGFSSPRGARPSAEWARSLCAELRPGQTQVLAYLRPQWEWIESSYSQRVKSGIIWAPFTDYVETMLASDSLDYPTRLDPWWDALRELEARPYSPDLLFHGDVVADFWRAAGLGSPIQRAEHFANRRPGARTIEMLRAIRRILSEHRLDDLLPVRRALAAGQRRIEAELPDDRPFAPLTPELAAHIATRFETSNEDVVRRYFGGRHAELFAVPERLEREPSTWSLEQASRQELEVFAAAVETVLTNVRGRPAGASRGEAPSRGTAEAHSGAGGRRRSVARRTQRFGLDRLRRRLALRTRLGLRG